MWRDWMYWLVAVLLFVSGVVWARLLGVPTMANFGFSDLVNIGAAIATYAGRGSAIWDIHK